MSLIYTGIAQVGATEHNKAVEQQELAEWRMRPRTMLAYYSLPCVTEARREYCADFRPYVGFGANAEVSTWTGKPLGTITEAHVYRHNMGQRFISIRVKASNGSSYYGRASYDNGDCIILHRAKE